MSMRMGTCIGAAGGGALGQIIDNQMAETRAKSPYLLQAGKVAVAYFVGRSGGSMMVPAIGAIGQVGGVLAEMWRVSDRATAAATAAESVKPEASGTVASMVGEAYRRAAARKVG